MLVSAVTGAENQCQNVVMLKPSVHRVLQLLLLRVPNGHPRTLIGRNAPQMIANKVKTDDDNKL